MAAKPKMTPEQWASTRATWEADPRKAMPWLIQELGLPVSAEALRLRAKSEGWEKGRVAEPVTKLAKAKPKLAELPKPKLGAEVTSLGDDGKDDAQDADGPLVELSKIEQQDGAPLTPKEERFVAEYLIDLNGTQAYKRVCPGVSDATAAVQASRLLIKPNVSAAVEKAKAERAARTGINADRALAEVWSMATADPRELVQVKVGCCRHCHGDRRQHQRQHRV